MGTCTRFGQARRLLLSFAAWGCAQSPAQQQERAVSPPPAATLAVPEAPPKMAPRQSASPPASQHSATQGVAAEESQAPLGLQCLAQAYGAQLSLEDQAWGLALENGERLPWQEKGAQARDMRLDHSSLKDMMAQPYSTGPIVPVDTPDWDPGRARNEKLFSQLYGASAREVQERLGTARLLDSTLKVHRKILPAVERVNVRLKSLVQKSPELRLWLKDLGGSYNWRTIAGTKRRSAHSWGIAIDLNPARSDYWKNHGANPSWRNRVPAEIVQAFEAEGFIWGGRWNHFDTMHFEYRPELLDLGCQGITPLRPNWQLTHAHFESLQARFPAPAGTQRDTVAKDSFAAFLRNLPLMPPGTSVKSYAGDTIVDSTDTRLSAVVDLDVGARDLQQCADSVIRLHAEWAYSANKSPIEYRAGNGARFNFRRYAAGERFRPEGNNLASQMSASSQPRTHRALRSFLDLVFNWVNTGALAHYSKPVPLEEIRPGDFFVVGGSPYGHAVLVLDIARNQDGEPRLLLGQGYMPAQSFHVLRSTNGSAWFKLDARNNSLKTPFWAPFPFDSLRRFPRPS